MKTFYGSSPGQDIREVVNRISGDDLHKVLRSEIVSLIESLINPEDVDIKLRQAANRELRDHGNELMIRREVRELCFKAMSREKLTELAERLDIPSIDVLKDMEMRQNTETYRVFLGFFGIGADKVILSIKPVQEEIRAEFGLFPHQRDVANRVSQSIRDGYGRVVLHMPTGSGKTRTAMHIVSRFLTNSEPSVVIWLAASAELLDQAANAFVSAWSRLGNREIKILRFWGDYTQDMSTVPNDCFIVAGLQKMNAFKSKAGIDIMRLANSVKLVVVDEAHQAIAPTYRDLIDSLVNTGMSNALIGLTATPGRTWSDIDKDQRLSSFFEGQKVMLKAGDDNDPVLYLTEQGYLARAEFRYLEIEMTSELKPHLKRISNGDDYGPDLLETLAKQTERNVAITQEIQYLIDKGHRRILFFGASVLHAETLAVFLPALEIEAQAVTAKTEESARRRIINEFRKSSNKPMVLCNFGVLTTGFDAPNTSAAVIARPTKSLVLFSQMVGRATRGIKAGGNESCTISTVVDIELPGFGDITEAFKNWEDVWHEQN